MSQRTLAEEFREIRRVSTPWVVVQTTDYRVTIRELLKVRINGEGPPPAVLWTCVDGPKSIQGNVNLGDADKPPGTVCVDIRCKPIHEWRQENAN